MTAGVELRTSRLLLRPIERSDIPRMLPLISAREVAATTLRIPHPYTAEDAERYLESTEAEYLAGRMHRFAIIEAATNDFCGGIGLNLEPEHGRAELGYWLGVPYWGRGFATEAARATVAHGFRELHLNRIFASVFAGNVPSRRVLEKAGMKYEGCFRQHVKKWDRFIDLEQYAVLASDLNAPR